MCQQYYNSENVLYYFSIVKLCFVLKISYISIELEIILTLSLTFQITWDLNFLQSKLRLAN